jgi:RNA polymerase sigma factor (sigma-70 family)
MAKQDMDPITKRALEFADKFAVRWALDNDVPEDLREDAKHEAFVETLLRVRTFDADLGARLEEWVRAQMEPRLHRWLKKQRMAGVVAPPKDGDLPSMVNATVEGIIEEEVSESPEEALHKLNGLTPSAREFLLKTRAAMDAGMTQAEIAQTLGVNQANVSRRLQRLTKKLLPSGINTPDVGNPVTGSGKKTASTSAPLKGRVIGDRNRMHPDLARTVISAGYPASAAEGQRGVRSPRSGPGTLSTRCSEWSGNAKFWTPERRKLRAKADAAVAREAREWRAMQWRDMVRADEDRRILGEGHEDTTLSEDDDGVQDEQKQIVGYLLRQAKDAARYKGTLLKGVEDDFDEE